MADFLIREWLLVTSGAGMLLTSVYTGHVPEFSFRELKVLFLLFCLFVVVEGLRRAGVLARIAERVGSSRNVPLTLVTLTFFLSMVVTNDAALVIIVPITLALGARNTDILVILEALAANAGSALTPFGNPQNLYLYWFYGLDPLTFLAAMVPFSLFFLVLLAGAALMVPTEAPPPGAVRRTRPETRRVFVYCVLLLIVILSVLRIVPAGAGIVVVLYAVMFDRKALRIDYALLVTFLFFFGLADNLEAIAAREISLTRHVFLFSALASQGMSNVPAAVLFAPFTRQWKALLWGTNAGGFGSLFGSLANLIAYKLYLSHESSRDSVRFTIRFLVFGYTAFFLAVMLRLALR